MGIPEADRHQLFEWIEHSFDFKDDREAFETTDEVAHAPRRRCSSTARALIAEKRAHPADDMLSVVCNATLPGEDPPQLTDQELQFFFSLLWAAGADTTRNAIAGAIVALTEFPDQLARARAPIRRAMPTAIEEIVRWTHPGRVQPAHRDARDRARRARRSRRRQGRVLGGVGEPRRARVRRPVPLRRAPRTRIRTSASATACTTASARTWPASRSASCSTELLARVGTIELTGPVEWTRSNKHTGIRQLPVRLTAR